MSFLLQVDEGLSLRLVEPRHAEEVYAVIDRDRDDLDVWMPWARTTRSVDDTRRWATEALRAFGERRTLPLTILDHGRVAGGIGLRRIDDPDGSAEIGYWLSVQHRGRGLATRAARLLIGYGFTELNVHRIHLWADANNAASRAVAERLGLRLEGQFKQDTLNHLGGYRDTVMYAVLQSEWNERETAS
ncbi:MAG: GNAT family protein [Planctomycetota bacterium]